MNLRTYKAKDMVKDSIQTIKTVRGRVVYISFAVLGGIGLISMALSLYSTLTFIVPFVFAALCLAISPVMEVYASLHLENKVQYSLIHGCVSTTYGYYHLIFSFVKAFVFGTLAASCVWSIILGFCSINNPGILDELQNILNTISQGSQNGDITITISELANNLIITLNILEVGFLFIGFFVSNRKNELSNAYSSAYLNSDKRFFLFNPLRKQVFNQIYRQFRMSYRRQTWWSSLIGLVLLIGGGAIGVFAGLNILNFLPSIDPYYFGAGVGILFYALWYGIERVIDSEFVFHHQQNIKQMIPTYISAQMESVKAIYKMGFPNGRFDGHSFPEVNNSGNIRANFNEETLKKFFFLYYSDLIIDMPATIDSSETTYIEIEADSTPISPESGEEKPQEKKSTMIGAFGFDDFGEESKKDDDENDKK